MMTTNASDQARIQRELASLSPEERRESLVEGHQVLSEMDFILAHEGKLTLAEERIAALIIEMIVRAECIENRPWRSSSLNKTSRSG